LGLDEVSMNPYSIPRIKKIIRGLDQSYCRDLVEEIMKKDSAKEGERFLRNSMAEIFPNDFIKCYDE